MTEWQAHVTANTGPLTPEQLPAVDLFGVTHNTETGITEARFAVEGATLRQATEQALRMGRQALGELASIRVITTAQAETELNAPAPLDLVDATQGAEILGGMTRQRFDQLSKAHPDFPAPVAQLSRGKAWTRESVKAFKEHWERRRTGRPKSASTAESP